MSICNRLDLQTLGSQPVIMPKNLPDHCVPILVFHFEVCSCPFLDPKHVSNWVTNKKLGTSKVTLGDNIFFPYVHVSCDAHVDHSKSKHIPRDMRKIRAQWNLEVLYNNCIQFVRGSVCET